MKSVIKALEDVVEYLTQPAPREEPVVIKECHHTKHGYNGLESPAQSTAKRRYDLIPMASIKAVAELQAAAVKKYGYETWKQVPMRDHYNHALAHIYDAFTEDESEETVKDSVTHAINRLMFIRDMLDEQD